MRRHPVVAKTRTPVRAMTFGCRTPVIRTPITREISLRLKKVPVRIGFNNDVLGCKCIAGRCPNYNAVCGSGGNVVHGSFAIKHLENELKRLLQKDINLSDKRFSSW